MFVLSGLILRKWRLKGSFLIAILVLVVGCSDHLQGVHLVKEVPEVSKTTQLSQQSEENVSKNSSSRNLPSGASLPGLTWVHLSGEEGLGEKNDYLNGRRLFFHHGDSDKPWVTRSISHRGGYSYGTRLLTDLDGDGVKSRDRSEVFVSDEEDAHSLKFGRLRYFGASYFFHPETNDRVVPVVIFQAVQKGHSPRAVPFVIFYQRLGGVSYVQVQVASSIGARTNLTSWIQVPTGKWFRIEGLLSPRYTGPAGHIKVSIAGHEHVNHYMHWGYAPGALDKWRVSTGLYRPELGVNEKVILFLDEIKWASSKERVHVDHKD